MLLFAFLKDCSSSCIRQEWKQKANSWNSFSSQITWQQHVPLKSWLWFLSIIYLIWPRKVQLIYNLGFYTRVRTIGLLVSKDCHLRKRGFLHSSRVALWEHQYDSSSVWHCQHFSCHWRHHPPSGRFISVMTRKCCWLSSLRRHSWPLATHVASSL